MTTEWQQPERGAPFMLKLLLWLALKLRRRGVRWRLYPTIAYFLLTSPRAVATSRRALRRFLHREATWRDVAKHFYYFSVCALDRIYLLSNQIAQFSVDTVWSDGIQDIVANNSGALLVVAHVGSTEALRLTPLRTQMRMIARTTTDNEQSQRGVESLRVSVLIDKKSSPQMTAMLERLNPTLAANIIDASERGPSLVLRLKDALQAGRLVGIAADRARADERAINVQFMGGTVRLPEGPWALAAALRVPVILGFGIYRGGAHYETHFELFTNRVVLSRNARSADLHDVIQRYAQRLEHYAQLAPYNWFNFYDYWLDENRLDESKPAANAPEQ